MYKESPSDTMKKRIPAHKECCVHSFHSNQSLARGQEASSFPVRTALLVPRLFLGAR